MHQLISLQRCGFVRTGLLRAFSGEPLSRNYSCLHNLKVTRSIFLLSSSFPSPVFTGSQTLRRVSTKMATQENSVLRRVITSPKAPAAIGPYSPAVQANNTLYISGQLGMDPTSGELVSGGVEKETEQALINMGAILHAAGGDYKHVVKVTVLLADIKDFQAMNAIYGRYFSHDSPARAAYQVAALPKAARVEIEAIAVLGEIRQE